MQDQLLNDALAGVIASYARRDVIVFHKTRDAFGGLSNMAAGYPLRIGDVRARTSEALYQACRFPHRADVQARILAEASPMAAKMVSKPFRGDTRPDWDEVRVDIMRWCLEVKLAQHIGRFGSLLLSTGGKPIVELSRKDRFWGAVPSKDAATLDGSNVLGLLLTDLRERFRAAPHSFRRIDPPAVTGLVLLAKPVATLC